MNTGKVSAYLELVPLPQLLIIAVVGISIVLLTPRRHRLGLSIATMVIWLTIGALPDLGVAQAAAKATSALPMLLIGLAALLHPGPRRSLATGIWAYPTMAIVSVAYVLTTIDWQLAVVIYFGWIILTFAALFTARTAVDDASFRYIVRWLTIGLCLAILLPASSVVLDPANSLGAGLFRLFPWGANPEGIGTLFTATAVFTSYYALRGPVTMRPIVLTFLGIAVGLAMMTASRGVIFPMALGVLPVLIAWTRRPILLICAFLIILAPAYWLMGSVEQISLDRIASLQSNRWSLYGPYLEVIAERPFLGLFGTRGESFFLLNTLGKHPHNAYLNMLYVGGISYALPMFILVGWVCVCAIRCLLKRACFTNDPILIATLSTLLLAMFLHGFVNDVVFYPTFPWSFIHVLLAALLTTAASALRVPVFAHPTAAVMKECSVIN